MVLLTHFCMMAQKNTDRIKAKLRFSDTDSSNEHVFCLAYAAGDSMNYTEETLTFVKNGHKKPFKLTLEAGKKESQMFEALQGTYNDTMKFFVNLLKGRQNCLMNSVMIKL